MGVKDRQQRDREGRRQDILRAAAHVFALHGLDDTTVEMIAREAQVGIGTIYLYFSSREDLYLSLRVQRLEALSSQVEQVLAQRLDPIASLRAISRAYLDHLSESRGLFVSHISLVYARLAQRLRHDSELARYHRVVELNRELIERWETAVGRAYDAGLLSQSLDRAATAGLLWSSLNGAFLIASRDGAYRSQTGAVVPDFCDKVLDYHFGLPPKRADSTRGRIAARAANPVAASGRINGHKHAQAAPGDHAGRNARSR